MVRLNRTKASKRTFEKFWSQVNITRSEKIKSSYKSAEKEKSSTCGLKLHLERILLVAKTYLLKLIAVPHDFSYTKQ